MIAAAGPLARADRHGRGQGGQGHVLREAAGRVGRARARRIRDAVRKAKRVFQTGTWQRSQGKFQQACELARNGYVGKIHTVEVAAPGPNYRPSYKGPLDPQPVPAGFDWEMWRGPAPNKPYNPGRVAWPDWYLIWDYCAGFISNWGVHHLDIANWGCPQLGTEPFEVECKATYRKEGFTDNVETLERDLHLRQRAEDGLHRHASSRSPACRFIGDKGWVHVDRSGIWAEPESLLKVKLKPNELRLTESKHHRDDFLALRAQPQGPGVQRRRRTPGLHPGPAGRHRRRGWGRS